jgi:hypothetical protein
MMVLRSVEILEFNKRTRKVYFLCSPSDVNAIHNVVRDTPKERSDDLTRGGVPNLRGRTL